MYILDFSYCVNQILMLMTVRLGRSSLTSFANIQSSIHSIHTPNINCLMVRAINVGYVAVIIIIIFIR